MMGLEGPTANFALSKKPERTEEAAALLVMMSLAFWIESPIIDLLSTATAKVKGHQSYLALRKFVFLLIGVVTLFHFLVPATSLFQFLTLRVLGIEPDIAERAHRAFWFFIPWSGAIAWRRFRQGVLIRSGNTRPMMIGTIIRLAAAALSGMVLYRVTNLPGASLAACVIITAVLAEALYVHFASLGVVDSLCHEEELEPPPSLKELARFHFPLTVTTVVNLMTMPTVAWTLSRLPDGITTKAAFQIAFGFSWILRSYTYGLTEAVLILSKDEDSRDFMAKFCRQTGLFSLLTSLVIILTGFDQLYFGRGLSHKPEVVYAAHLFMLSSLIFPLVTAAQSYYRGVLTRQGLTPTRVYAAVMAMAVLVVSLYSGSFLKVTPIVLVAAAIGLSYVAEWLVLLSFYKRASLRPVA